MRHATTRHGVILMLAAVMPTMAIIALVPVLPLLLREFADVPGAAVLVPMALTVPALCVALFSPLAGWLSDRLGRKRLLIGGQHVNGVVRAVVKSRRRAGAAGQAPQHQWWLQGHGIERADRQPHPHARAVAGGDDGHARC